MSDFNIFNIDSWQSGVTFEKNKIIQKDNFYYYATSRHVSSSDFTTDYNNNLWGGKIIDNGEVKPYFIWKPSYNHNNTNEPRIKTIQFSDGYEQTLPDGINNLLMNSTYVFEGLDLAECSAILHFLYARAGSESFLFLPPAPYGTLKRFRCKQWEHTQKFVNNYQIQAKFVETVV